MLSNSAGYAEENSLVEYGNSFCYYNCTVDVSMATQCRNHANILVSSSPPTVNQSILTQNGLHYNISDLQRCQRYTVEVTAQVGAHKYTNQTQDTVMLRKSALWLLRYLDFGCTYCYNMQHTGQSQEIMQSCRPKTVSEIAIQWSYSLRQRLVNLDAYADSLTQWVFCLDLVHQC